jgi:alkaline phosphatase
MKNYLVAFAAIAALTVSISAQGKQKTKQREPEAKNVILMIGDGMGVGVVTSLMVDNGFEPVNMERATFTGFVKTYSYNNRVTDSAASGTAYATGSKTFNSRVSVDSLDRPLETILEKAEKSGMPTGLVTTIALEHATPAVFYAHAINRSNYADIAGQLPASGIDVAIGGGRAYMENREDGRNIISELREKGYTVAESLEGLEGIRSGNAMAIYPGKTYGIPSMKDGRDPEYLPNAVTKALEILTANSPRKKGFFMMVEGSQIDGAAHANDAGRLVAETRDFDNAVGVAMDYADSHPGTLVVVLADHDTGGSAVIPGDEDFTKAESGVSLGFSTGGHSANLIPLFAYGTGAENFTGVLENDEIGCRLQKVLGLE